VQVENPAHHGSLDDVVAECAAIGLEPFRQEVVRDWGSSRVDIALIALRRSASTPSRRKATGAWSGVGRLIPRVGRGRGSE
jgi:hypothetical protein